MSWAIYLGDHGIQNVAFTSPNVESGIWVGESSSCRRKSNLDSRFDAILRCYAGDWYSSNSPSLFVCFTLPIFLFVCYVDVYSWVQGWIWVGELLLISTQYCCGCWYKSDVCLLCLGWSEGEGRIWGGISELGSICPTPEVGGRCGADTTCQFPATDFHLNTHTWYTVCITYTYTECN